MAEPAANEASQQAMAEPKSEPAGQATAEAPAAFSAPQTETTPSTFQAVNAKAVVENSHVASNTPVNAADVSVPTPPPRDAAVAQDASQTAQTSSAPSHDPQTSSQMDDIDGAMATDTATYGTRSRNRTGNPRPNYAEDQDMDFEMSAAAAASSKKKGSNEPGVASSSVAGEAKRAQEFARFIGVNGSGNATPTSNANGSGGKELTPGVATNPSKKRKAAAAPVALTQTPPASNSPAPTASRKVAAPSAMARETNILTFTKHRSCLNKKGELIADDGTKLCVNGKPPLSLK